ncbi:hypothetical protein I6A84_10525 [Frankia sp. CNm7]|uniref:Uncharacterized protein n=1 Tax=Frankia nepalensis TaxID=1836974 RepID=A0A937UQP9_9ACTN|nr:hypothetical protein [Frankia nepalensis]MBL7501385.1 hypothetical protein [Frankia nepalensis]MBL7511912.1 hypothetical protein [Frankia nepalensis]MBL7518533.1 hypothetical protein [Frankia nepalensis]MBL7628485.1 hypothetical protein [Frankia nepalensis]
MNIQEFYTADPRRRESEEVAFGEGWTEHADPASTYRLSWVEQTQEIYAVREPHPGGGLLAPVLDYYNVHQADVDELRVDILAVADLASVDAALAGWHDQLGERDSLRWARQRLAALPRPVPTRPADRGGVAQP